MFSRVATSPPELPGCALQHCGDRGETWKSRRSDRTLKKSPTYANAHYHLGNIHFNRREWDSAESYFAKVIELQPEAVDAYISTGLIYGKRSDYVKALAYFQKAQEIQPGDSSIERYVRAAQQKLDEKKQPQG